MIEFIVYGTLSPIDGVGELKRTRKFYFFNIIPKIIRYILCRSYPFDFDPELTRPLTAGDVFFGIIFFVLSSCSLIRGF